MNPALVQLAALAWLLFGTAMALMVALAYPWLRGRTLGVGAEARAWALRALAAGPVVGGALLVALCFAPKLFAGLRPSLDHCAQHGDHHLHLCFEHPPVIVGDPALGGTLVLVALLAVMAMRLVGDLRRSRPLRAVLATARFDRDRGAWIAETRAPLAFSVGAWRPRTLLTSGLVQRFPEPWISVVVAHERAHAARRDAAWQLLVNAMLLAHLPSTARRLRADLELACEQACDERAADAVGGDRWLVARVLLEMARTHASEFGWTRGAVAFAASSVTARAESLLRDRPRGIAPGQRRTLSFVAVVALLALAISIADPLHHVTETFLHFLLG